MAHHLALGAELLHEEILLLQRLRVLKAHLLGSALHIVPNHAQELSRVAFQYLACRLHVGLIVLDRLLAYAASATVLYMVFEAGLVLPALYLLGTDIAATGARMVELLDEVEHGVHGADMGVRAEICAGVPVYLSCGEYPREILVCDADGRVGLAVLEEYVVARAVFLYESILEQQRVLLGVHHGVRDVHDFRDKHLGLESVHLLMEIGRYAALEVLCLAYIDYRAVSIVILIAAGLLRHVEHYVFQACKTRLIVFFHKEFFMCST